MNPKLKLSAYIVLIILVAVFGWSFYSSYSAVTKAAANAADSDNPTAAEATPTNQTVADTNAANVASTNADATATNASSTNLAAAATNAPDQSSNALAQAATNEPAKPVAPPAKTMGSAPPAAPHSSRTMIRSLLALIAAVIALGLLITYDVTQIMGNQAVDFLFNDEGEGQRDPEYERAEQVWANGKFLDAIQMMRDYLKKHPREQYVSLRIAEIYEKDLRNYLAAALEYEEVLKHKLPPERWGWAAVHLCNLYSKLNQQDKKEALLHRIADEYPQTGAAKKARSHLGLVEIEAESAPAAGSENLEEASEPESVPETGSGPDASDPKSNLPPGFRPKK